MRWLATSLLALGLVSPALAEKSLDDTRTLLEEVGGGPPEDPRPAPGPRLRRESVVCTSLVDAVRLSRAVSNKSRSSSGYGSCRVNRSVLESIVHGIRVEQEGVISFVQNGRRMFTFRSFVLGWEGR